MARPKKVIIPGMAERIKKIRTDAGLSQAKFGERIELSDGTISFIESETTEVSGQTIALICSNFNVNRKWLETGEGDQYISQPDDDEEAVVRAMFGQSEAKKRLIAILAAMPDEMYEAFEKAYAERLAQEKTDQ